MGDTSRSKEQSGDYYVELNERPCVVKYVPSWEMFLVGTYQLLSTVEEAESSLHWLRMSQEGLKQKCEEINHRAGSLVILAYESRKNKFEIVCQHRCMEGGVFDLVCSGEYIFVAHANNTLGVYSHTTEKSGPHRPPELIHLASYKLEGPLSTLLTSIDACIARDMDGPDRGCCTFVCVGDSQGCVTVLSDLRWSNPGCKNAATRVIARKVITKYHDPIWNVKFCPLKVPFPLSQPPSDENLTYEDDPLKLVVACEDSRWSVCQLDVKASVDERIVILTSQQDFTAGVTSISFLNQGRDTKKAITVILGSYDETLKIYTIGDAVEGNKDLPVKCVDHAHIPGGGIWRVKPVGDEIYVAAMYAGSYKASISSSGSGDAMSKFTKLFQGSPQPGPLSYGDRNSSEASLHYDIDICEKHKTLCVADFNKRLCLLTRDL